MLPFRVQLPVLILPVIRGEKGVPESWNVEELLHHGVHVADAAEVLDARKFVRRASRVLWCHSFLFLLVQLQDEWVPEVLNECLNQSWVRVRVKNRVEKGVSCVPRLVRVALVHLSRQMTGQVDTACDVPWIGLLSLVKQAVSNQHRHDVTALSLIKDVTVSFKQGLSQLDDSHEGVISDDRRL